MLSYNSSPKNRKNLSNGILLKPPAGVGDKTACAAIVAIVRIT
jgi:hypothetical protein